MTDPSPPPSPVEPRSVGRRDELLSALIDGEVSRDELAALEELAVGEGTTLEVLAGEFQQVRDAVAASVIDLRAPAELRDRQLAAALDSSATPGIASLAAARASRQRRWGAARRQPLLQGAAAALLIVAGIGMATLVSRGGSTSEDTATAGTAQDPGATLSRQLDAAGSNEPAADEAEQAGDDAAAGAEMAASEADAFSQSTPEPLAISGIDPADLGSVAVFEDVAPGALSSFERAEPSHGAGLICAPAASALGDIDGFAVVDVDGELYEVFRTVDASTAVFDRLDCARVD